MRVSKDITSGLMRDIIALRLQFLVQGMVLGALLYFIEGFPSWSIFVYFFILFAPVNQVLSSLINAHTVGWNDDDQADASTVLSWVNGWYLTAIFLFIRLVFEVLP